MPLRVGGRPVLALLLTAVVVVGTTVVAKAQTPIGGFDPGADGFVYALAVQPDGKVLVGGDFSMLGGGGTGTTARSRIGRLNPDGSIDPTFNPGANGTVKTLVVQPDGRILVGGDFTVLGGQTRTYLGRLNADGSLDTTFNPGANSSIEAVALQADGKILVGGGFSLLGGGGLGTTARNRIGRLLADGSVDTAFDPGANSAVFAMVVQPDGKVVVGGSFSMLGGGGSGSTARTRLGRLNADGTVDAFNPGANDTVTTLALQPDGKILVGGRFTGLGGGTGSTTRNQIGRLLANGSVDSTLAVGAVGSGTLPTVVDAIVVQPDGKILVGGFFIGLGGQTRNNIGRLGSDGTLDTGFNPGADSSVYALALQPDGKTLVGGTFVALGGGIGTQARNRIGRVNAYGLLDAPFNPGADGGIVALAVQPDGKIAVGGSFAGLGGGTGTTARSRIGRLLSDGTVDGTFNPGADLTVLALAVQPDGKILVGGAFSTLAGTARSHLGRLNTDGTIDASFNPAPDYYVRALVVQPDGKILVGGEFTSIAGGARNRIARLNANGTLDVAFNPDGGGGLGPGANGPVYALALQADGHILVGGAFNWLAGSRNNIARLDPNGGLDPFAPETNGAVRALAVQANQEIVLGGDFTTIGGTTHNRIGRVRANGTDAFDFFPSANGTVQALALETSGNIVVGGTFTSLSGHNESSATRNRIGRFNSAGALDATFDPGANNQVYGLAIVPDGDLLVVGAFTGLGGGTGATTRNAIGRLTTTVPVYELFYISSSAATWFRGAAGPKFSRTTFESSTNGVTYAALGAGTNVGLTSQDQWSVTSLSLPLNQNVYMRFRGWQGTGLGSGSESITEVVRVAYMSSSLAPPAFGASPGNQVVGVGAPVSFTAAASSGYPLPSYRWQLSTDGGASWAQVPDAAPYVGVNAGTLFISGAPAALNGVRYRAVASNSQGSANSLSALLTVSASPNTELVGNGTFSSGTTNWLQFATPDMSYITSNVTAGGVLQFARTPPPPGTTNQAVVFQQTGQPVPTLAPVVAAFQLGNTSNVRKRISVLVHDADFTDLSVCTFWLPANAPLAAYGMATHSTRPWVGATISFYAATANAPGDTGFYQLDNVSVQYQPAESAVQTRCIDPTTPAPPGGADGLDLLVNGDFGSGAAAPGWSTFGQIQSQVLGNVFEFIKLSGTPAGVVLQPTGQPMTANQLLTATFQLGNSSSVRKRVTVILHDNNFTDLSACTFWLAPGQALSTYTYRTFATQAWANGTLSVYPATVGSEQWIRLDNVTLRRTPSAAITGTECLEPGAPTDAGDAGRAQADTLRPASLGLSALGAGERSLTEDASATDDATSTAAFEFDGWLADGFARSDEPSPLGARWSWVARGEAVGPATLTRMAPIDLTGPTAVRLTFQSWLSTTGAPAQVQVSTDGVDWHTIRSVASSDGWMPVEIDLGDFAGEMVHVRFVLDAGPAPAAAPEVWHVGDVSVDSTGVGHDP